MIALWEWVVPAIPRGDRARGALQREKPWERVIPAIATVVIALWERAMPAIATVVIALWERVMPAIPRGDRARGALQREKPWERAMPAIASVVIAPVGRSYGRSRGSGSYPR